MYIKNTFLVLFALTLGVMVNAQDLHPFKDSLVLDSHFQSKGDSMIKNHRYTFGKEKPGTVCINGLEKLEFAAGTDQALNQVLQLHFYGPGITSGRVFAAASQEKNMHFVDMSMDFTIYEFPLHLAYSFGLDQIGHKPNVSYIGPGLSLYLSDMVFFHKYFHILRYGVSYEKITEHLSILSKDGLSTDSSVVSGYAFESVAFYQIQPYHITHDLTIFSEGLFRLRGDDSFMEYEVGLRHSKFLDEMVGLGLRLSYENFHYHKASVILRFSLSSPNPRHLKERKW